MRLNDVDVNVIKEAELSVVSDAVNRTGGVVIPTWIKSLKCKEITEISCIHSGEYTHNEETRT